ncbi:glycosyltransferase family 2 protein [Proteus penneri]|uniref:Gt2 n=1 Tax=Proteus penneri TaxID=102862 RepID=A0A385JNR4_9GAMM|nr:glycosyltransferase family 2 protein [Proteus penneri]AXY99944.1 gt2 [Proteus penneri]
MKDRPVVSILSANYNNGHYLNDFFHSIENQSYTNFEIVIIDDCSTDNSDEIIRQWILKGNLSINYIKLPKNLGFANALNTGLAHCKGTYIARIDPDDVMHPSRLEKQIKILTEKNEISLVGSNAYYFQESINNLVGHSNFRSEPKWIKNKYLSGEYGMMHGTIMFKATLFKDIKYSQSEVPAEDYSLISRMIKSGNTPLNSIEKLTYVRIHDNSVSNDLPLTTIIKVYILRMEIFNIKTSTLAMILKFFHFKFYRNFLKSKHFYSKIFYLSLSVLCSPIKAFKIIYNRFISNV